MDAAWELASAIEESVADEGQLFGISLDLSKAYNTLRRDVLEVFALRCGWPPSLVRAYLAYLDKLDRFFKLGKVCMGRCAARWACRRAAL